MLCLYLNYFIAIFYGGIFDLSDIEKLKDLIKSPATAESSTVATVSRRNEGLWAISSKNNKEQTKTKTKDTTKTQSKGSQSNQNINANDLKSLLSKFIQLVPSGDSSDSNNQGGIEIEFNPISESSDDENDETDGNNSESSQIDGDNEGEKDIKKNSNSKTKSNSGKKKSGNKSKKQSIKRSENEGQVDTDESESDDENSESSPTTTTTKSKKRRTSNKKKGSKDSKVNLNNRSDFIESTTTNANTGAVASGHALNYNQGYPQFNPYPQIPPNYNQLPPPPPLPQQPSVGGPGPSVLNNQYSMPGPNVPYNNYPPHPSNYAPSVYNSHSHHGSQYEGNHYGPHSPHSSHSSYNHGNERVDGHDNWNSKHSRKSDESIRFSAAVSDVSKNIAGGGSSDTSSSSSNSGKSGQSSDERGFSSVINVNFPEFFKPSHSTVNHDTLDRDSNVSNFPIHRRVSFGVMANGLVRRAMKSMAYRLFPTMKNVKFIAAKGCRDVQSIGSLDSIIMPLGLAVTLHPLLLPLVPFFLLALGSIKAVESATCFVSEYFK